MSWSSTKKASCWRSSGRSAIKSVATSDAGGGTPPQQPALPQADRTEEPAGDVADAEQAGIERDRIAGKEGSDVHEQEDVLTDLRSQDEKWSQALRERVLRKHAPI